jgi:hypothetical protein
MSQDVMPTDKRRIYVLNLLEAGAGGLAELSANGALIAWPKTSYGASLMGYQCEVINYSKEPIFNLSFSLTVRFMNAVNDGKSIRNGTETSTQNRPIYIQKIDAGTGNGFTFYVINFSGDFIDITLPTAGIADTMAAQDQHIKIMFPLNLVLTLYPFMP